MKVHVCLLAAVSTALVLRGGDSPRTYRVELVAGSGTIGDGGAATAARIGYIQGIAVDRAGNVYIAETDNHRVRKIFANGIISTVAGTGKAGFGGDGGPAADAQLSTPYGLATDAAGNLYIADLGNNRVRRVGLDGTIATVAGTDEVSSFGDGGQATSTGLLAPRNIAIDGAGNIYISEFEGHRVRKVAPDGVISTAAGTGIAGYGGDGGRATNAQLNAPAGLTIDSAGNLYIADSANQRVRKVSAGGAISTYIDATGAWISPVAVSVVPDGTCYVADGSYVVWKYRTDLSIFAGSTPGFSGDGGAADAAQLKAARDLAADSAGNVYIADSTGTYPLGRVRKVDTSRVIRTIAGHGYMHSIGDGAAAEGAQLNRPSAVSLDSAGNLYIADPGTQRVRRVDAAGVMHTLAGTGAGARGDDGVLAATGPLYVPHGVWVERDGSILVAETYGHRIRRVGASGYIRTIIGTGSAGVGAENTAWDQAHLNSPKGVCTDGAGTIYVVDSGNHRVLRAAAGGLVSVAAGNGTGGYAGDGGQGRGAMLAVPSACAVDLAGNLFIADTGNNRIRKVDPSGLIRTVAGDGLAGSCGDEGPATAACLSGPAGLVVTGNGDLFIADTGNNRIRQVTPDGVIHTIAGQLTAGATGDGGPALEARFDRPSGLVLDGAGDLYVADTNNNLIRRLVPESFAAAPVTVVNAASLQQTAVAPGEAVTIYGSGLGPESEVLGKLDSSGLLATAVAGVEVRFDGIAAPLFSVRAGQITAQAPYDISGKDTTHIEIRYNDRVVGSADVPVSAVSPAVFPVVANEDGTVNSQASPAARGTIITFCATGEGMTDGNNTAGLPAAAPYARPRLAVAAAIDGLPAEILYAGSAPGMVGQLQVNARVPAATGAGAQKLELAVGDAVSPPVTVWLK